MKIAIVGCGDIGVRTARLLVDCGHHVVGVRRNTSRLPHWIECVSADVSQRASLEFLSGGGFDVVIYCLAAAGFNEAAYRTAYVTGLSNTVDALHPHSIQRLIFVSSTSVYHQNDGSIVDEDSATNPVRFNGQLVLEGERLVRALPTGTVVRFSGIYGSGRTRMIDRVKNGIRADPLDTGYTNRIHVEDCAGVLAHLVNAESTQPDSTPASLYLASDSAPCTRVELETFIAGELGIVASGTDGGSESQQADTDSAKRIAGSKRCNNARLLQSGYQFLYPDYISGYRQVLSELSD